MIVQALSQVRCCLKSESETKCFSDYGLLPSILKDVAELGYQQPTPIQAQCIPPVLEGKDVIGLAQTGTGKTAAFGLPIIQRMAGKVEMGALILAPTRELAQQIAVRAPAARQVHRRPRGRRGRRNPHQGRLQGAPGLAQRPRRHAGPAH